jgi:hypothetical protein
MGILLEGGAGAGFDWACNALGISYLAGIEGLSLGIVGSLWYW